MKIGRACALKGIVPLKVNGTRGQVERMKYGVTPKYNVSRKNATLILRTQSVRVATVKAYYGEDYTIRHRRRISGKNLQKALSNSHTADKILDTVAENAESLDHIHCVTAVYRLAKVVQQERKSRKGRQVLDLSSDERFQVLKDAIEIQITKLDSWATANLLYSFALLGSNPGYSLLDALTGHAVSLANVLCTVDVSNVLWAFGQFSYKPHTSAMDELWNTAINNVGQADGRAISGLTASALKIGYRSHPSMLVKISHRVIELGDNLTPRELTNIFISLVRLGFKPQAPFYTLLHSKMTQDFDSFSNRDLALSLSAYRLLNYRPDDEVLNMVLEKLVAKFDKFDHRDIIQILSSLGRLKVHPGNKVLDMASNLVIEREELFTGDSLLRLLESYISLGYKPSADFVTIVKQKNKKSKLNKFVGRFEGE